MRGQTGLEWLGRSYKARTRTATIHLYRLFTAASYLRPDQRGDVRHTKKDAPCVSVSPGAYSDLEETYVWQRRVTRPCLSLNTSSVRKT